jgi:hypothetical protein
MVQQINKLVKFLLGDFDGATSTGTSRRLRQLIPIARDYAPQLRDFGILLVARLTEKSISRGLTWATERLKRRQSMVESLRRNLVVPPSR